MHTFLEDTKATDDLYKLSMFPTTGFAEACVAHMQEAVVVLGEVGKSAKLQCKRKIASSLEPAVKIK